MLSRETLRLWLMEAGLWQSRKQRDKAVQQPRNRRECLGELIQIDGFEHAWFEGRGPKCTLLVYVDDATGRLMELRFVESETTFDYFHATRRYLERFGKPVAFYSDKHSVFRVNQTGATGGTGLTQFGRALHELNIDILYANSSQAKGRVDLSYLASESSSVSEVCVLGSSRCAWSERRRAWRWFHQYQPSAPKIAVNSNVLKVAISIRSSSGRSLIVKDRATSPVLSMQALQVHSSRCRTLADSMMPSSDAAGIAVLRLRPAPAVCIWHHAAIRPDRAP